MDNIISKERNGIHRFQMQEYEITNYIHNQGWWICDVVGDVNFF
jgi:hypothetical protein